LRVVLERPARELVDLGAGTTQRSHALLGAALDDAASYQARFGSLTGRSVLVAVPPGAAWARAFFGVVLSGGAAVPLPLGARKAEVEHVASLVAPVFAIATPELASALPAGLPVVAPAQGALRDARPSELDAIDAPPERAALILFTSGTTGKPKAAPLSHANLAAQVAALHQAWGSREDDVLLHALPMHHLHGVVVAFLQAFTVPSSIRMLPKFEAARVAAELEHATVLMGVPTFYQRLCDLADSMDPAARARFEAAARGLRLATSGSAALPATLAERWAALAGAIPLERYGMTEIGMALSNPLDPTRRRRGHVGGPLPSVEVRTVDDAGRDTDAAGELWVRGPSVFGGYLGAERSAAFEGDWFKTGDVAVRADDGALRLLGRTSTDILKTGGEKVSALEIEEVLREHPQVVEVAVIGLPDAEWGDRVVAVVVPKGDLDPSELRAWTKERLVAFKVPKEIRLVPSLPRNAMGKVEKTAIRDAMATAENSRSS
jgi:malonyl-CoA/methylmalonyl-CoA synthetase